MTGLAWWTHDSWEMIRRNLVHIRRTPELLLDVTLSPIMFVLLFSVVFGGAISVGAEGGESASYTNFLLAGHLRADGRVRGHLHQRAARQRPAEGHDRPIPVAADGTVVRTDRAHVDRPASGRPGGGDHVGRWPGRRLPSRRRARRQLAGHRHHAAVRVRTVVGWRRRRRSGPHARGVAGDHLRRRLPAHLRQQRLRPDRHAAGVAPALRGEPALHAWWSTPCET